jgi:ferrochelatase
VVLLNLGGPERLQDVKPFLYNLFADPEIIRLPVRSLQRPLATLISTLRAEKSKAAYARIGGGSPQRRITEKQARDLENVLRQRGRNVTTYIAMRYWHPFTETAIADLKADGVDQVVVLPLYPHFSISTSGSSFRELQRLRDEDDAFASKPIRVIRSYYDDPQYIGAMAELIARDIRAAPNGGPNAHVFFSAHGVPRNYVDEAGDPYKDEIEACTKLIMERLRDDFGFENNHTLAYQSRVGPLEWLKPYTEESLLELAERGIKDLVVVPISFTGEHIETLEEIDIEYRELATEAGISNFLRVPTLGQSPTFIKAMADLVENALERPEVSLDEASVLSQFPAFGSDSPLLKICSLMD